MKPSAFLSCSFWTICLLFASSCGNNEQKTDSESTNGDTTTTTTSTTSNTQDIAPSTIVTTPQAMMVARHRVSNFNKWKASYDAHDSMRLVNGLHNYVIGRSTTDSNMVLVAVKADDMAKAKAFSKDPSLKQAMQKGGVTGTPTFNFITMTFQDTATIASTIRSMVLMNIKAWTPWKESFESGKENRMQNGLTDRAYGYESDDTTKAVVVLAVTDTAKARMYWNSDQLKQRRAQGGVIGEPKRFVFNIVQRY